jgi:hypothetical protein
MLTGDLKQQKDLPVLVELKMTCWGYSTSNASTKGGSTLVTLPRIVTPYGMI